MFRISSKDNFAPSPWKTYEGNKQLQQLPILNHQRDSFSSKAPFHDSQLSYTTPPNSQSQEQQKRSQSPMSKSFQRYMNFGKSKSSDNNKGFAATPKPALPTEFFNKDNLTIDLQYFRSYQCEQRDEIRKLSKDFLTAVDENSKQQENVICSQAKITQDTVKSEVLNIITSVNDAKTEISTIKTDVQGLFKEEFKSVAGTLKTFQESILKEQVNRDQKLVQLIEKRDKSKADTQDKMLKKLSEKDGVISALKEENATLKAKLRAETETLKAKLRLETENLKAKLSAKKVNKVPAPVVEMAKPVPKGRPKKVVPPKKAQPPPKVTKVIPVPMRVQQRDVQQREVQYNLRKRAKYEDFPDEETFLAPCPAKQYLPRNKKGKFLKRKNVKESNDATNKKSSRNNLDFSSGEEEEGGVFGNLLETPQPSFVQRPQPQVSTSVNRPMPFRPLFKRPIYYQPPKPADSRDSSPPGHVVDLEAMANRQKAGTHTPLILKKSTGFQQFTRFPDFWNRHPRF